MDLNEFGNLMQLRAQNLTNNINQAKQDISKAVLTAVVKGTPVDTGKAKSNWQVNIGGPTSGTRDAYIEGKRGSTAEDNESAVIDAGVATIAAVTVGQEVHITNNLLYIGELNDGTSTQAPAGFVEAAVMTGVNMIPWVKLIQD